ncbi:MAG: histone deacetylase [Casimicrobiaceae bacterium]|nr:histone deacetylase [Casimicrobiaceae bacterium]
MRCFYSDHFVLPLPEGHRFPMAKYRLLRERVAALDPTLLEEAPRASDEQLLLAHDAAYIERLSTGTLSAAEIRAIGFPWSPQMAERARRSTGATIAALCFAIETGGCGINLAGGTHHAFRDHGEGFCCYNDAAVAARVALERMSGLQRIAIIDLDVHQGNGTAAILRDDPRVFTFSMHGAKNYPVRKEQSDLDVELPDGTDDETYLRLLAEHLPQLLDRFRPQALIYLAGADPYEGDRLGRLALTRAGLAARDRFVLESARRRGLPVAIAMAGGYAEAIEDIVAIHFSTVPLALEVYR